MNWFIRKLIIKYEGNILIFLGGRGEIGEGYFRINCVYEVSFDKIIWI